MTQTSGWGTRSIKLGLIANHTGPLSFVGLANVNAARMVAGKLKVKGGLLGRSLLKRFSDTGYRPWDIDMMKTIRTLLTVALLAGPLSTLQAMAVPLLLFSSPMGGNGEASPGIPRTGGSLAVSALHLPDLVESPFPEAALSANCLGCEADQGLSATDVHLAFNALNAPNFASFVEALTPTAEDLALAAALNLPSNALLVGLSTIGADGVGTLFSFAGFDFQVPDGFAVTEVKVQGSYVLSADGKSHAFDGSFEIFGEALAVPEPSTAFLVGLALVGWGWRSFRRVQWALPPQRIGCRQAKSAIEHTLCSR